MGQDKNNDGRNKLDHGLVISELTLEEKREFTTEFTENTETSFI